MSLRSIKAGFIIAFVMGLVFLALGIYGAYIFFTVELPAGHITKLPLAVFGSTVFGLLLIIKAHPIFIPLKKNASVSFVCPSCGALVDENAEVCDKCKRPLENQTPI